MNLVYFALILISLVGPSVVRGQCDSTPAWKIPESCCNFNLIDQSIIKECKGGHHRRGGGRHDGNSNGGNRKPNILKMSCPFECAFNTTGLYAGSLNEAQIRSVFTTAVRSNTALTTILNSALNTCLSSARNRATEFSDNFTNGSSKCNPTSAFVFACITTNLVANCPAADFQASDPTCVAMQAYFRQCPIE